MGFTPNIAICIDQTNASPAWIRACAVFVLNLVAAFQHRNGR